jgi:hypothetical protein
MSWEYDQEYAFWKRGEERKRNLEVLWWFCVVCINLLVLFAFAMSMLRGGSDTTHECKGGEVGLLLPESELSRDSLVRCPLCRGESVERIGVIREYHCKICRRTFFDYSGTRERETDNGERAQHQQ